jgi:hypothetical protein
MKKVFFVLICVLFLAAPVVADVGTMYNANQATIFWASSGDGISYNLYTKNMESGTIVLVASTTDLEYTLTFTEDQAVLIGVQSVKTKTVPGVPDPVIVEAETSWSDMSDRCADGETFGIYYVSPPPFVVGIGRR